MVFFFFLLFVSGPFSVFFFKAYPGSGASNSSSAADLTSRAAPSCSGSSDEKKIFLRLLEIGQAVSKKPSTHLSMTKNPFHGGEQKLQDEYVLDSQIHSRPDPSWNFRNLQKH